MQSSGIIQKQLHKVPTPGPNMLPLLTCTSLAKTKPTSPHLYQVTAICYILICLQKSFNTNLYNISRCNLLLA
jgi:hypothetical protein